MGDMRRGNERVVASVRVRLADGAEGVTTDMSPSGIYFTVDQGLSVGQVMRFSVEFPAPGHGLLVLDCEGRVVRVDRAADKVGAAVVIVSSRLERKRAARPDADAGEPAAEDVDHG